MVYLLVLVSVVAMSGAQLLLKKGLLSVGYISQRPGEVIHFFFKAFASPYIIGAALLTVATVLAWLLAL